MIYLILIYILIVVFFSIYSKIGFFHIHKNKSIADIISNFYDCTQTSCYCGPRFNGDCVNIGLFYV